MDSFLFEDGLKAKSWLASSLECWVSLSFDQLLHSIKALLHEPFRKSPLCWDSRLENLLNAANMVSRTVIWIRISNFCSLKRPCLFELCMVRILNLSNLRKVCCVSFCQFVSSNTQKTFAELLSSNLSEEPFATWSIASSLSGVQLEHCSMNRTEYLNVQKLWMTTLVMVTSNPLGRLGTQNLKWKLVKSMKLHRGRSTKADQRDTWPISLATSRFSPKVMDSN